LTDTWPEFDPRALLAHLLDHEVDFVVIGGIAAVLLGSARITRDLDICYSPVPANLERLGAALVGLGATLRGITEKVPFVPDERTLRRTSILTLDSREGPIDLLLAPDGAPSYSDLRAGADDVEVGGIAVPVAGIDDLIAMKKAAGRPKDFVDVEELEAIKRLSE
jgi:hypothetical protein